MKRLVFPYSTEHALATYYIIMPSEVSANLARYDGIKYGYSTKEAKDLFDFYLKTRREGFGQEVRRRIMLGNLCLISRILRCLLSEGTKNKDIDKTKFR